MTIPEPSATNANAAELPTESSADRAHGGRYLLAAAVLIPILLAWASYQAGSRHDALVHDTLQVSVFIRTLDDLFSTVQDAETGQRGYLLSKSQKYLAPYLTAEHDVRARLQAVEALAVQRHLPRAEIAELRRRVQSKMDELHLTVSLAQQGQVDAAIRELLTGRGQRDMAGIREMVESLRAEQSELFQRSYRAQQSSQRILDTVLGCGVLVVCLLLLIGYLLNQRYIRERDIREGQIRKLNENLEQRVRERTVELEERATELQRANSDLLQFAYIASHDLKEPLRMVASYMGMLARRYRGALDGTADTYIQFAIEGAERMQSLVSDLLLYATVGTQAINRRLVPFARVVDEALANLQLLIEEHRATVVCGALPALAVDPSKLAQVIQNLVSNSIKFSKPDVPPLIEISAEASTTEWVFRVADNGIGFDGAYAERIFQVFQRLHPKASYPGNGIGLAVCRRIIEHHGGRLWAESQPGSGSTFFFTLPAQVRERAVEIESDAGRRTT